jgi:uncharacterized protein YecA (UPF0149 family)
MVNWLDGIQATLPVIMEKDEEYERPGGPINYDEVKKDFVLESDTKTTEEKEGNQPIDPKKEILVNRFTNIMDEVTTHKSAEKFVQILKQRLEQRTHLSGEAQYWQNVLQRREPKKSNRIKNNDPCHCGSGIKYKNCCRD